ncbi:hypothetical protein BDF22DRAFT_658136 [Syncephalis plumigaleata]|nr:hypothetical protein BDF22DRAFT_658136 [Syncephalis plumigaleata]
MKSLSFSSTVLVSTLVAVAYIQQALGTPYCSNLQLVTNDDVSKRWVTLPVGIPDKLHTGLTVTKVVGYGIGSAMGVATYNGQERFIKCGYYGMASGEDKILKAIAKAKQANPQDETVKKYRPSFCPKKFLMLNLVDAWLWSMLEMSLDNTLDTECHNRDRIIYDIAIQLLKAHRLLHQNQIIYNNMNLQDPNGIPHIKLVDFDMSVMFKEGKPLVGRVANQDDNNSPPEFGKIKSHILPKADTWFIGARLYQLITDFYKNYANGLFAPPSITSYANGGAVAKQLIDLVKDLLAPKVGDRPTPEEYLNRPVVEQRFSELQSAARPRN